MKLIQSIINLIVIPLFVLIFLTAGIGAAFLSALIEYSVIQGFFSSSYLNLMPGATFALLLVSAFEVAKLFFHFIQNKDCSSYGLGNPLKKTLTVILISVSLLCSLIFTVTTFYLPEYNSQEITKELEKIDEELATEIESAKKYYNEEYNTLITPLKEAMEEANNALLSTPLPSGSSKMKVHKEILEENVRRATSEYNTRSEELMEEKNKKINKEITRLTKEFNDKKDAVQNTTRSEVATKYDNPVLSSFLTVLSTVFFQMSDYTRTTYFLCCILMSLIISIVLEVIIYVCMVFLNVPVDILITTTEEANAQFRATCQKIVITSFKAICAFSIYLLILSFKNTTIIKTELLIGILAIALSVFLTNYFFTKKDLEKYELKTQIYYSIQEAMLQGVISLVGFVFLGFLFGNEALTVNLNTIGVGIGTALSGGIIQLPKLFLADTKA